MKCIRIIISIVITLSKDESIKITEKENVEKEKLELFDKGRTMHNRASFYWLVI